MNNVHFDGLLEHGVEIVLESMFFTTPYPPADDQSQRAALVARVAFEGQPSGMLCARISETSARSLAASFLGEDRESLSEVQIGQVMCELTNMLCGSFLSQLEHDRYFMLAAPQLLMDDPQSVPRSPATSERTFGLEDGVLSVFLYLDLPHEC
jgi:chemotaxis protein CheY-P-specific phosphatase CheC